MEGERREIYIWRERGESDTYEERERENIEVRCVMTTTAMKMIMMIRIIIIDVIIIIIIIVRACKFIAIGYKKTPNASNTSMRIGEMSDGISWTNRAESSELFISTRGSRPC